MFILVCYVWLWIRVGYGSGAGCGLDKCLDKLDPIQSLLKIFHNLYQQPLCFRSLKQSLYFKLSPLISFIKKIVFILGIRILKKKEVVIAIALMGYSRCFR